MKLTLNIIRKDYFGATLCTAHGGQEYIFERVMVSGKVNLDDLELDIAWQTCDDGSDDMYIHRDASDELFNVIKYITEEDFKNKEYMQEQLEEIQELGYEKEIKKTENIRRLWILVNSQKMSHYLDLDVHTGDPDDYTEYEEEEGEYYVTALENKSEPVKWMEHVYWDCSDVPGYPL